MKNLMKLSYYLSFALLIGLTACGGDDDDDDDNTNCDTINEGLQAQAESIATALVNSLSENSVANCEAFNNALDDYIDFIQDFRSCLTDAQQDELDTAIDEFENSRVPCEG